MSAPPGVTGLAPDDWQLLRQHFEALCDLPAPAQQTALTRLDIPETLRLRLAAMLGGDQSNGLTRSLQRPLRQLASEVGQLCRSGQRIGAYRLLSPLGRGGMGTVWLAERADGLYEGRVAIKFVGHGDFQQQFELERRLLARLDHRGIARLLDAGADDDDTPYVVMELVEGETLEPGSSVTIEWENGEGLVFRRIFEVDEHYLFTVTQEVQNDSGQAVGWSGLKARWNIEPEATLAVAWHNGQPQVLGTLAGDSSSQALGINNVGQVVGWSGQRAFLWQSGAMLDLQALLTADSDIDQLIAAHERPLVARSMQHGEIIEGEITVASIHERVRVQCIPVRHQGRPR